MFIIDDIGKNYGKKQVLNHISFQTGPGDCIGLLGINGSGKSTLLNILSGGMKATHGSCYFEENEKTISFLPQHNPLIEELTGLDNLKLWFSGKSRELKSESCTAILERLGINAFLHQRVSTMSGGMKKRLSLAICMLEQPNLLLLDEPLAALDLLCKKGILDYLKAYTSNGGSIIIATHEEAALSICNQVYVLKNGCLQKADDGDFAAMLQQS